MTHCVEIFSRENGYTPIWSMPLPHEEIRTIFINWSVSEGKRFRDVPSSSSAAAPFTDLIDPVASQMTLSIKQLVTFNQFTVRDFGLQQQDRDAHTPSLYLLRKSAEATHADRHRRSAAGQQRDAERRTLKKRQAKRRRRY